MTNRASLLMLKEGAEDEKVCAMCGCGVIIYYLKEPFREYEYLTQTEQWREWGRNNAEAEIWDIYQLNIYD